jgi:hypothetical protein
MKALLPLLCVTLLSGCIVVPQTVSAYDAKCDIAYRKKTLAIEQVPLGGPGGGLSCNDGCAPLLIAMAVIPPASAVVSGSIVVVGNTISWIERRSECLVSSALGA